MCTISQSGFALWHCSLALQVGVGHESIGFRHKFLMGLMNKGLAKKASDEEMPIGDVIQQARRMESHANQEWMESGLQQPCVAAISTRKEWDGEPSSEKRTLKRAFCKQSGGQPYKRSQRKSCGRGQHEIGYTCPAGGKESRSAVGKTTTRESEKGQTRARRTSRVETTAFPGTSR